MWHMTCRWKDLDKAYNFALDFISIRGLQAKLWGPKVAGFPTLAILGLPLGSLGVRAVVSLMSPSCPWLVLTPKVLQLCINHFVLVLCKPMWVSKACQFFLIPSRSSSMPLYPSKVLQARERALTPHSSIVFCLGLTFESFKELGVCLKQIPLSQDNVENMKKKFQ
jgi:hypothetical protein